MQYTNEFKGEFRQEPPSVQLPDLTDFINFQPPSTTDPFPSQKNQTQFKFTEITMENTAPPLKKPSTNNNSNNNNVFVFDVPKPRPTKQQQQQEQQPFRSGIGSSEANAVVNPNWDEDLKGAFPHFNRNKLQHNFKK